MSMGEIRPSTEIMQWRDDTRYWLIGNLNIIQHVHMVVVVITTHICWWSCMNSLCHGLRVNLFMTMLSWAR